MKTTALAFIRTVAIWLAFAAITLIYLFGVSAMRWRAASSSTVSILADGRLGLGGAFPTASLAQ